MTDAQAKAFRSGGLRAIRGLLHMHACSVLKGGSLIRMFIVGAIVSLVVYLTVERGDTRAYWELVLNALVLQLLPLYLLVRAGETLRGELRDGTMEYLWTRPVRRSQLFIGFYLSSVLSTGLMAMVCFASVIAMGLYLGVVQSLTAALFLFVGAALCVLVLSAVSLSIAAYSSKFVVLGIFYYLIVEYLLRLNDTGIRFISVSLHAKETIELALFEGSGRMGLPGHVFGMLLIAFVALIVGILIFSNKCYVVGGDKDA